MKRMAAILATALALATVGCSDDSGETEDAAPPDTTPTTQPPALNDDAVAQVQALVDEHDRLAAIIDANPAVVNEPDNADLEAFVNLHTEASTLPDSALANLRTRLDQGRAQGPPEGGTYRLTNIFAPRALNSDVIRFEYCLTMNAELTDTEGDVVDRAIFTSFGEAEARREGDRWLLHELTIDPETQQPYDNIDELPEDGCDEAYVEQRRAELGTQDEEEEPL